MNRVEAGGILRDQLGSWRSRSYQELANQVGESHHLVVKGASGTDFQVAIQVVWDDEAHGNIRVIAAIDDGGWRALLPLTDAFILAPDGSCVAE